MKKTIILIFVVLCSQFLGAQNFATRQLEYLASLLNYPLPAQSGSFRCPEVSELPLKVEYDATGAVCHLGLSLFADSLKQNALNKPLYDFQERLFLEVFLGDEAKARKLMGEYCMHWDDNAINFGIGSFFTSLEHSLRLATTPNVDYVLTKDSLTWTSSWQDDLRSFSICFPANFDLITGMDKKEAEIWFAQQLQNIECKPSAKSSIPIKIEDMEQLKQSIYVRQNNNLFIKDMNNNLYFECRLVYDRNYPEESIANLFNYPEPQRSKGLDLQIKQIAYGYESYSINILLSDFQCFMSDDYEVFTGIEKCNTQTVEFSVIYKSKWYNYSNLLYVQTTRDNLFDKTEPLRARFYTFIPNQNIKNLYKEYTTGSRNIPWK